MNSIVSYERALKGVFRAIRKCGISSTNLPSLSTISNKKTSSSFIPSSSSLPIHFNATILTSQPCIKITYHKLKTYIIFYRFIYKFNI